MIHSPNQSIQPTHFHLFCIGTCSVVILTTLAMFTGCVSGYHISESDDGLPGRLSFQEFAKEVNGKDALVTLTDGSSHEAADLSVSPDSTAWRTILTNQISKVPTDSVRSITWTSSFRGALDGFLIGIPAGIAIGGLLARSPDLIIPGLYSLAAVPVTCAIVGGFLTHTFKYRILSNRPLPQEGSQFK